MQYRSQNIAKYVEEHKIDSKFQQAFQANGYIVLKVRQNKYDKFIYTQPNHEPDYQVSAQKTSSMIMVSQHIGIYASPIQKVVTINFKGKIVMQNDEEVEFNQEDQIQIHYFSKTRNLLILNKVDDFLLQFSYYNFNQEFKATKIVSKTIKKPQNATLKSLSKIDQSSGISWFNSTIDEHFEFTKIQLIGQQINVSQFTFSSNLNYPNILKKSYFDVVSMWQHKRGRMHAMIRLSDNFYCQNDDKFSPILFIKINEKLIEEITFSNFQPKIPHVMKLKRQIQLTDYQVIRFQQGINTIYILDNFLNTVQKYEQSTSQAVDTYGIVYQQNSFADVSYVNKKIIITKRIINPSIVFDKFLLAYNELSNSKDTSVLVILGENKSGKTTLRHYLSKKQLQFIENPDIGYGQLKVIGNTEQQFKDAPESEYIIWSTSTNDTLLVELPYWNDAQPFIKNMILLYYCELLKRFTQIRFILAIPEYSIQNPQAASLIIQNLLSVFGIDQGVESAYHDLVKSISIVFTKVSDQSAVQTFKDKIDQFKETKQIFGQMIQEIVMKNRTYIFQNQPSFAQQGSQLLKKIISSDPFNYSSSSYFPYENQIIKDTDLQKSFISASFFYLQLFNQTVKLVNPKDQRKSLYINTINNKIKKLNKNIQLKEIQNFSTTISEYSQAITLFKKYLNEGLGFQWVQEFKSIFKTSQHLKEVIGQVTSVFNILNKFQKDNLIRIKQFFQDQLSGALFQSSTGVKIIKKKKIVAKSYTEEKNQILLIKNSQKRFEKLLKLPSNALKLDLIFQELQMEWLSISKQLKDYTKVNFLLKQACKICQIHELYQEALILLMIIPDFNAIEDILQLLIKKIRSNNNAYKEKQKLFLPQLKEIIQQLITKAQSCLRDNLLAKLLQLDTLNNELLFKQTERQKNLKRINITQSKDSNRKDYQSKLKNEKENMLDFYDKENYAFQHLLEKKKEIINNCTNYEKNYQKQFGQKEMYDYFLDFKE